MFPIRGVDSDCDGSIVGEYDGDRDGYRACEECDDSNRRTHPGARERCDGLGDDCDGSVDEDCAPRSDGEIVGMESRGVRTLACGTGCGTAGPSRVSGLFFLAAPWVLARRRRVSSRRRFR